MTLNTRSIVLIVAALAIAGIAALLARSWLASEQPKTEVAETAPKMDNQILSAAANLPAGRIVQKSDLAWQRWPLKDVPADYILRVTGKEADDILGAVVRSGIHSGEPIGRTRIVNKGDRGFLSAVLTPGMRAVAVKVTAMSGVGGFIFPGDRVDVMLTQKITKDDGGNKINYGSQTLLTNVRVIAIDQRADDQQTAPAVAKTVTIEVTPKQAESVALAQEMGDIVLSLRSVGDPDVAADGGDLAPMVPQKGETYTRDSDISRLVAGGGGRSGDAVVVVRGGTGKNVKTESGR